MDHIRWFAPAGGTQGGNRQCTPLAPAKGNDNAGGAVDDSTVSRTAGGKVVPGL
ncbi:hypothetical protein GCM10010270_27320 [Streptomyces violaceus]|nr:hypothetical protein GCM10010270_27320 [Streptomyces janthinus]